MGEAEVDIALLTIASIRYEILEFSLNVFTEFAEFNENKYYILKEYYLNLPSLVLESRRDRIFKLSPIHASVIYQIP